MNGWIDASKVRPVENGDYLCRIRYDDGEEDFQVELFLNGNFIIELQKGFKHHVLYWMPIPELPNDCRED